MMKNPNDVATEPHEITHAPDASVLLCRQTKSRRKPKNLTPKAMMPSTDGW